MYQLKDSSESRLFRLSAMRWRYYKKQQCSEMSRQQADTVNKTLWICPTCTKEENLQLQVNVSEIETESQYVQTKSKTTNLKIIQLNIDAVLYKVKECKVFVNMYEIDVFTIQ